MADRSRYLADRVFDNSHCMIIIRMNEHQSASNFRHLLAILQNLSASENRG